MRKIYTVLKFILLLSSVVLILILIKNLAPPIWRNWITYPQMDKQISEFKKLKKETPQISSLKVFEGHFHLHSYWSHDSEGKLSEIVDAAKNTGVDFVFLSDHPHGNSDTFPRGYQGIFNGVLIEPGSEKKGMNVWPFKSTVIDWNADKDSIAKSIVKLGGLVTYSHTEESHSWKSPWYQGMEIYNFHTDTKDEETFPVIAEFLVNGKKYRHLAYRSIFDNQVEIQALWDSLNLTRKIVGFSGIDTHENQNFRARLLNEKNVEWLGPNANVIDTMAITWWNKWLFKNPDQNGWVFKWMIDTYDGGFNYVSNYLLADSLTVSEIKNHFNKGHLYTAFKSLADASGFMYYAVDNKDSVLGITGDSVAVSKTKALKAVSPFPGQYRLIRNGVIIEKTESEIYDFNFDKINNSGVYRVEIHLKINGKLVPWLFSNPIYIY